MGASTAELWGSERSPTPKIALSTQDDKDCVPREKETPEKLLFHPFQPDLRGAGRWGILQKFQNYKTPQNGVLDSTRAGRWTKTQNIF